jgi:ankyrin repeat protein
MEQQQQNQLLQQEIESDFDDDDDESNEFDFDFDDDDDPLSMGMIGTSLNSACDMGDMVEVVRRLDGGKNVDCVDEAGWTPLMYVLWYGHGLNHAEMLVRRGADLSKVDSDGRNCLHFAAACGIREIHWVLANTRLGINSTSFQGHTPIRNALYYSKLDAAKHLIEKGANLFIGDNHGESFVNHDLGPQVLQHAKNLIWESVKPLLLLSSACSTSTQSSSLINVFNIEGIVRDYIAPYIMRKGLIIRDPEEDVDEEPEADEVKLRIEAGLAAGSSLSIQQLPKQSYTSNLNKRAIPILL